MATKDKSVSIVSDQLPTHAQNGTGAGNENVSARDMLVPRLKLLQDLSPETKKTKPEYIEGAEPGMIFNTVTKTLSKELFVVNLYYDHEFVLFRNRDFGGGYFGAHNTSEEAFAEAVRQAGNEENARKMFDVVESGRHTIGIIDPETGEISPAIMEFTSTKMRVSAQWNTDISASGGDRFSSAWKIEVVEQSNNKGSFYNYKISRLGFVSDEIYAEAHEKYQQIRESYAAGKVKTVD